MKKVKIAMLALVASALIFSACTDEGGDEVEENGSSSSSLDGASSSSSSSLGGTSSSSSSSDADAPPISNAWWTFTLSNAGESYADVDGKKTYRQGAVTEAIAESIDLVAYHNPNAGNNIYGPAYIAITEESLARIFRTEVALLSADDYDDGEEKIAISVGDVFYLESSKPTYYEITVIEIGSNSVTLSAEPLDGTSSPSSSSNAEISNAWWTFTLSNAGESYADVDSKKTYRQGAVTEAIAERIDLVAYHNPNAGDNVYGPAYIAITEESLARIFRTSAALLSADDDDDGEEKIAISVGDVFYLESSEFTYYEVTVIEIGSNSVTLSAEPLGEG